MARRRKTQKTTPRGIDPQTGELREGSETPASKRSGFFGALRRVAKDAVVRRTSTKG